MTNPTSNFGWQMPTSTDLVTDLPADFEVFGQAVDTSLADLKGGTTGQVLKKNTNADMDFVWSADAAGMTNPMTTTGDTIYSSSGSTPARLGIGSTGNVLTVAAGVPTWAAPAGSFDNYELINAGGTALTGASTITVSGINKNSLIIVVSGASSNTTNSYYLLRLNTDSGNNYAWAGLYHDSGSGAGPNYDFNATSLACGGGNATDRIATSIIKIDGVGGTGYKWANIVTGPNVGRQVVYSGYYKGTSAISSISLVTEAGGNFDAGTIFVYGA